MGLSSLNARLQDPAAAMWVGGIFPKVPLLHCCLLLSVSPVACARLGPLTLARAACCRGNSGGICTICTVVAMHTYGDCMSLQHVHPAAIINALKAKPHTQDTPRNMRFSINFFTSIGLGGLTDDMREHLKVLCRAATAATTAAAAALPLHRQRRDGGSTGGLQTAY